jgi:uncharacterized tellurite resistance protein B-like protein
MKAKASLEDAFFLQQDAILIQKRRELEKMKNTIEEYAKVTGITNEKVLEKFYQLQLSVDIVASLSVIPLIEVAWADGKVDDKEKHKILNHSDKFGVAKNSIEYELVERWLSHKPDAKLLDAWTHYIKGLCAELSQDEKNTLCETLLEHVHDVAGASGGFLGTGFGNKISASEQQMIDRLKAAFD